MCLSGHEPASAPGADRRRRSHPRRDVRQSLPRAEPGQTQRPVEVSADIHVAERRAVITLVVAREARDLEVRVRGIDGVTIVTPSAPVRAPTAPAGEKITLDVSFSSTNPDGTLVVEVEGTFAGRPLGAVRTFSLGKPPAAGPKDPPRTDASGRPIVVLPGN
jgi:hypothetical protein